MTQFSFFGELFLLNTMKNTDMYYCFLLMSTCSSSAHRHKLCVCAVNHCWLIENAEWSVADAERPQPPSDSPVWPDLFIASILSASVSEVLMWAWGTHPVWRPASRSSCSCVANGSPCATWQRSSYKKLSKDVFVPAVFFQSASGEYIWSGLSIFCLPMNWDMYLNHWPKSFIYYFRYFTG